MIKSLMKNFHLPIDILRITLTPFLSRLNDQSIKEIRLRIARILNWVKSEILFSSRCSADLDSERFHEHTSLRHDLLTAFLNRPSIQLNIHTTKNRANTELD